MFYFTCDRFLTRHRHLADAAAATATIGVEIQLTLVGARHFYA